MLVSTVYGRDSSEQSHGRDGRRVDDKLEVMLMTTIPGVPRGAAASPDAASVVGGSGSSVTKFLDPMPIPPVITVPSLRELWELEIVMRTASVKLHSQLPATTVWTYNGSFPGPTIRLRRGQKLRVTWCNEITGDFPVKAVQVQSATPFQTPGPGRDGVEPREDVAALPPWTLVHLHGAQTGGGNDGWTENGVLPGNAQLAEYPNDQRATTMWYHDHAMAITALNVMSGLMGMYLIRDDEEEALELPDRRHEVPLIICDRNLDTDADGNLTGELLHKANILQTTPERIVLPFLGPFTLVNGVIWPHFEVDGRWTRFRVLNASNSRFYRFELRDEDGAPISEAMRQIGTDGGLLPAPVVLDQLTLAPAERADILIDFRTFRGRRLTLVNTLNPPFEPGTTTPNPDVMQFRVRTGPVHDPFTLPSKLSPSFVRLTHDTLPHHHGHRWLVLTLPNGRHPEMWEMIEIDQPPPGLPVDGIIQVMLPGATTPTTLQRVGRTFRDAANFYIAQESWEQWRILNVSAASHPIHLHLIQFQALSRQRFDVTGFDPAVGGTTTPVAYLSEGTLDPNEQGWKDTIRVNGTQVVNGVQVGELVSIIGQFSGASGRFMYHCHILEHEDEGMMSTFVVMPEEVMAVDPHMGGEPHHRTLRQTTLWDSRSRYVGPT
jgi:o-aminophenol oxidase